MDFLSEQQLAELGLGACGHDVRISEHAVFYGAQNIHLGDHVRIDAFCVLSAGAGGIRIGNRVHIAAHAAMFGQAPIVLHDFAQLSGRSAIYSSSDDFSGQSLLGPTVPAEFRSVEDAPVTMHRHAVVGTGSTLLPGTEMAEGSALGAMSLATGTLSAYTLYAGIPARPIGQRSRNIEELARRVEADDGR